jgi:hypothetical protein
MHSAQAQIRAIFLTLSLFSLTSVLISASPRGISARQSAKASPQILPLDSLQGLDIHPVHQKDLDSAKLTADVATYRNRRALHLLNDDSAIVKGNPSGGQSLAIVSASDFADGSLSVDLVGIPRKGSPPDTRGFVGLAFHVQDNGDRFEAFYLRFTNGRAEDQLRRNHSAQYVSEPEFPWFRLRQENPGLYESYVDIEAEAWTNLRITVAGKQARLFVNHAAQPCLIVNDLKLGPTRGQIALWDGSNTEAYFSNLRIDPR